MLLHAAPDICFIVLAGVIPHEEFLPGVFALLFVAHERIPIPPSVTMACDSQFVAEASQVFVIIVGSCGIGRLERRNRPWSAAPHWASRPSVARRPSEGTRGAAFASRSPLRIYCGYPRTICRTWH